MLRETDIFARYGGDEFVVLLPQTKSDGAFEVGERIRKAANVHRVSSVTTVEAALAAMQGLFEQAGEPLEVRTLQEYHAR